MISLVRYTLLLAIIGLLAASYLTWEPLPQDGSQPIGDTPANQFASVMDRWAERIPSLKDDILSLRDDLHTNFVEMKNTASEQSSFLTDFQWDSLMAGEESSEATESSESFMMILEKLREQLGDVNMEDLSAKVQELIGKTKELPQNIQPEENTSPDS